MEAAEKALGEFAEALVRLHIYCGAPPLRQIERATASRPTRLSAASISEAMAGKRLPSMSFALELVRQLTGGDADQLKEWRTRWSEAKHVQKKAEAAKRRRRQAAAARDVQAPSENDRHRAEIAAEFQRAAEARGQAEQALREASVEAGRIVLAAQQDARSAELTESVRTAAEDLLAKATAQADQIRSEAWTEAERIKANSQEARQSRIDAVKEAEKILRAAETRKTQILSKAEQDAERMLAEGQQELAALVRRREDIQAEISRVQDVLEALESFSSPDAAEAEAERIRMEARAAADEHLRNASARAEDLLARVQTEVTAARDAAEEEAKKIHDKAAGLHQEAEFFRREAAKQLADARAEAERILKAAYEEAARQRASNRTAKDYTNMTWEQRRAMYRRLPDA